MKKILTTIVVVCAITQLSFAQWVPGTPSGSYVINSGNVGIGTTNPAAPIDVRKNGSGYTGVFFNTSATGEGLIIRAGSTSSQNALVVQRHDGNTALFNVRSDGNVGIGTPSPAALLHVYGTNSTNAIIESAGNTQAYIQFNANGNTSYIGPSANNGLLSNISNGDMVMRSFGSLHLSANNTGSPQLTLTGGFVGIGTTTPQEALSVNGNIRSKQVKVETANWPDYVFKPTYSLPPLLQVKNYIDKYQHLPDMPSETEVAKEGLNLGEINKLLTKKVEELTLYLIEQDKRIAQQNKNVAIQQKQIDGLARQLEAITKAPKKN